MLSSSSALSWLAPYSLSDPPLLAPLSTSDPPWTSGSPTLPWSFDPLAPPRTSKPSQLHLGSLLPLALPGTIILPGFLVPPAWPLSVVALPSPWDSGPSSTTCPLAPLSSSFPPAPPRSLIAPAPPQSYCILASPRPLVPTALPRSPVSPGLSGSAFVSISTISPLSPWFCLASTSRLHHGSSHHWLHCGPSSCLLFGVTPWLLLQSSP